MAKKESIQKENPKLIIPFSEGDLQDLINGEEFRWTFTTDKGQDIDVLLRSETQDDLEDLSELDDHIIDNGDVDATDF